ncbi:MAG: Flp pilus assembly complex ATPase component TadA [Proteobacteria bacterium]|nr:Flp pilus assembly complex ATPase component TadA [Burkholderiales bacterium]
MAKELSELIADLAHDELPFSEIHLVEGAPIALKLPGGLRDLDDEGAISRGQIETFLEHVLPGWKQTLAARHAIDCAVELPSETRLQVNVHRANAGQSLRMVMRRIPRDPLTLKDTGLPPFLPRLLLESGKGLVIVTGSTGAGKTTTLFAALRHIMEQREAPPHIITIEEPIEYVLRRPRGVVTQREVGVDTASFSQGLRESLRQGPDVIMVGEVRDRDTADTMLRAAESGHLVLATVHSSSAEGVISKIVSLFHPDEQAQSRHVLKNVLIAVVCQVLLPKLQRDGFALAAEILINSPQVARAIEDPARLSTLREFMRRSEDKQSRLLNDVLVDLVRGKRVSRSDALLATYDRQDLLPALDRAAVERDDAAR